MADTCNASSSYTCRVLQSDELDRWLEHTYRVFLESKGERAPDRRYFERHVHNDPASVDEVVRNVWVAVDAADRILGALRVFRRRIYLRGSPVQVGGVGEVSVLAECRRQGIASALLQAAAAALEQDGVALSSLHTSTSQPLYARYGWVSLPRRYARVQLPLSRDARDRMPVEPLDWQRADQRRVCQGIYDAFCRRWDGCTVRDSDKYWERWVRDESGGIVYREHQRTPSAWIDHAGRAYAIVQRQADNSYRVRELVVSEHGMRDASMFLKAVLGVVSGVDQATSVPIVIPEPLVAYLGLQAHVHGVEEDAGQMYRIINGSLLPHGMIRPELHVAWDTDTF
ncbi:hypothetical protein CDCA_CDCA13G3655 [Cyanidium caldarium]|uniref:N-acetyltransferase domain-containing protein n=1 Tax=Cyanidium caldarium TaxID=2771 RepID=A0AAV9IZY2_CYACA|nr:hypothetical protein CDCA_CDCA13G3655 [Cyanidium caldarium]